MARRRFFVDEIRRGTAELTGPNAEHLVRVLRVEVGQVFEISDNQSVYLAEVTAARKSSVEFLVTDRLPDPDPSVQITLLPALIKFDSFEWMVEKATELGVAAIQPFEATRSERGLLLASQKRLARWQRIALEASEQSRRAHLPRIAPAVRFGNTLTEEASLRLLLDESNDLQPILEVVPAERSPADHVALLLGPEGGWTDAEREEAIDAGWLPCSLGQTVLRAETAAIAALAIIQAVWAASNLGRKFVTPPFELQQRESV